MNRIKTLAALTAAVMLSAGCPAVNAAAHSPSQEMAAVGQVLAEGKLEEGNYKLNVEMIKTDRESYSMSNNAINHSVLLTVENGEYYVTMQFLGLAIYNKFGYLQTLSYFDEGYSYNDMGIPEGETVEARVLETYGTVDTYNDEDHLYPKVVKFKLVDKDNEEYIPLQVFVPIMEAISQGTGTQPVLMKPDWSSLEKTEGGLSLIEEEKQSSAADLFDDTTGVTVHADEGIFPEGTELRVNIIDENSSSYSQVSKALEGAYGFTAYEIGFLSKGEEISPNGKYTLCLPMPEGAKQVQVYRVTEGKKTLVNGSEENGAYCVTANRSGIFALAADSLKDQADDSSTSEKQEDTKDGSSSKVDDSNKKSSADTKGSKTEKASASTASSGKSGSGKSGGAASESTGAADDKTAKADKSSSTSGGAVKASAAENSPGADQDADNTNPESGAKDSFAVSALAMAPF